MKYTIILHLSTLNYRVVCELKDFIYEIGGRVEIPDFTQPIYFHNIPESEISFIQEYLSTEKMDYTVQRTE